MKKLLLLLLLFCLATTQQVNAQTSVLSPLTMQLLTNGQTVLYYKGLPLTVTRGQVLDLEKVNLAQPSDKSLMVLHEDGSGGCFGADKASLFIKDPEYGYWVLKQSDLITDHLSVYLCFDQKTKHSFISIHEFKRNYDCNEGTSSTQIILL